MHRLIKTIKPLTDQMYLWTGTSLEEYWNELINDYLNDDVVDKILKGTLTKFDIAHIEEELTTDAECGALWNYVHIDKTINLAKELEHTKKILLNAKDCWEKDDKLEDILTSYCYYKIGKYEIYSFQIDSTRAYKNTNTFKITDKS